MPNLLFLVQSMDKGGRTKRIVQTRSGLEALGYKTKLVVMEEPPPWVISNVNLEDYELIQKKGRSKIGILRALYHYLASHNIKLIHAHCEASFFYGGLCAKLSGVTVVGTYHRSDLRYYKPSLKNRFYSSLLNQCVAISNQRQSLMEESLGIPRDKISLIHGGANIESIEPKDQAQKQALRLQLALNKQDFIILSLGHLGPIKGHDDSIRAMSLLIKQYPSIKLYIGGDGSIRDYQRLEVLIDELGLGSHVVLLGQVTNPIDWLQAADLFLQPSREEGFGLVFAEAGAAQLPVVATNVGGIPDIVLNGLTGMLVEPQNPSQLAEAIEQLQLNTNVREKMGKQARERIINHFSVDNMVNNYHRLFDTLLCNQQAS